MSRQIVIKVIKVDGNELVRQTVLFTEESGEYQNVNITCQFCLDQ